jgi:hypothetical protein
MSFELCEVPVVYGDAGGERSSRIVDNHRSQDVVSTYIAQRADQRTLFVRWTAES